MIVFVVVSEMAFASAGHACFQTERQLHDDECHGSKNREFQESTGSSEWFAECARPSSHCQHCHQHYHSDGKTFKLTRNGGGKASPSR